MTLRSRTSHPLARSYVLKLDPRSMSGRGRVSGRMSHVVTGRQFRFTSTDDLIARLVKCDRIYQREEGNA